MKKKTLQFVMALGLLFLTGSTIAQDIKELGFSYQAVARDDSGLALANKNIVVEISIRKGTTTGLTLWQETHEVATNKFGLFNVIIGKGVATGVGTLSSFDQIDWSSADYFTNVRADFGNGLLPMGVVQLQATPYAFVADTALAAPRFPLSELLDVDVTTLTTNDVLKWNGTVWIPGDFSNDFDAVYAKINADSTAIAADLATEVTDRIAGDAVNATAIADNTADITTNADNLAAEITRATNAETAIATDLATEVTDRIAGDNANATAIADNTAEITTNADNLAAEITRATNAETAIATDLATEVTDRIAGDAANATAIADNTAEITTNADNLAAEITRATNAETAIATDLATEVTDRIAGDNANATAITDNAADITTNADNLAAEITRATNAETVIAADLATEVTDRIAGDAANATAIADNTADITTNADNLAAEITRATNAETAIAADLVAEETARIAGDAANATAIADNTADITTNADNLAAEITRATNAETVIADKLTAEEAARIAGDAANATAIAADLAAETTARIAGDAANATAIATETTNRTNADALKANIASPTLTGVPAAPTAIAGTNTTQIATTEFVTAAVTTATPDATDLVKGKVQLAGDLTGTAELPRIADDAVTTVKILDANVTNTKIADDAVTTAKIADANVTNEKLDTGIDAVKLADGSVSNTELQYINTLSSNAQTQLDANATAIATETTNRTNADALKANIASPTLTGVPAAPTAIAGTNTTQIATTEFVTDAVTTATPDATDLVKGKVQLAGDLTGTAALPRIADDAVTTAKILDANVTNTKIANDAVTTVKILDANVTTAKILDANVTNAKLATGIDAVKLADGSVSNTAFQYINTLSSNAQTQLNANATAIATETTNRTNADALKANIASPTLTGVPAAPTAIAGTNTTQIATTEFVTAAVTTATPDATDLVKGKVQLAGDLTGTAALPRIANDAVTTAKILDANVTNTKIADNAVTTAKILDANVTNAKLATGIDAVKLADGSVSNTELQYLDGVTSNIQTQLNAKAPIASPIFTGTVTAPILVSGDVTYPNTDGTAGQVITTNGSGALSWATAYDGLTHFTESTYTNSGKTGVKLVATNAEANVDVVIGSKGTGALLAQQPDGTAVGGNNRGTSAVDLQTNRGNATQVASGSRSVIAGGSNNTASGNNSFAAGGSNNTASGTHSIIIGGENNTATHSWSSVIGGNSNSSTRNFSSVIGGAGNTVSGDMASILGGNGNISSGSNSSVIGGQNNTAHTVNAAVIGGQNNTASESNALVLGGTNNNVSGSRSSIVGGLNNTVSEEQSTILGGEYNVVSGRYGLANGRYNTASSLSEIVFGQFALEQAGDAATFVGTDRLFTLGNGTATNARSSALTVLKNGNTTIAGTLTLGGGGTEYTLPNTRGTDGQVLSTNGSGELSWAAADVPDATTVEKGVVQLAGDLTGTAASPTIANDAVTTAKILNANVTADKLASNAVTTVKILDANVTAAKIADANITSAKLQTSINLPGAPTAATAAKGANTNQIATTAFVESSKTNSLNQVHEFGVTRTAWNAANTHSLTLAGITFGWSNASYSTGALTMIRSSTSLTEVAASQIITKFNTYPDVAGTAAMQQIRSSLALWTSATVTLPTTVSLSSSWQKVEYDIVANNSASYWRITAYITNAGGFFLRGEYYGPKVL